MTQQQQQQYDPTSEYSAPVDEWAALLSIAAERSPARAVAGGGWRADYFASEGAPDAYQQLVAATSGPLLLTVPPSLDGAAPLADDAQLATAREKLARLAQWRDVARLAGGLAQQVRDLRRVLGTEQEGGVLDAAPEVLVAARRVLDDAAAKAPGPARLEAVTLGALADQANYWARVADQRDAIATPLAGLTQLLGGGLQAKRLAVLLGGPGSGKSTLANHIAENAADAGRPVVYLTLEDAPAVMLARTVARIGALDYAAVLEGREKDRAAINGALVLVAERMSAPRLAYVEDSADGVPIHPDAVRELARQHFARFAGERGGRGLLVVDYLQRWARALRGMPGETRELRELVSWLTERLRLMARELDCSVLCIASQNRASGYGNGGGSALASAKESGDIEYTADVVMALGEPSSDRETRRQVPIRSQARVLRIDKNRQGPVGSVQLDWRGDRQQFTEAAQ